MYDSAKVSPVEEYARRNAKSAKLESKRADLQAKRNELFEELRALHVPFTTVEDAKERAEKRQAIHYEMRGIRFDLDQLHAEILNVWRSK